MPRAEADHIDAQRTPTGRRRRRPARGGADAVRRAAAIPYQYLALALKPALALTRPWQVDQWNGGRPSPRSALGALSPHQRRKPKSSQAKSKGSPGSGSARTKRREARMKSPARTRAQEAGTWGQPRPRLGLVIWHLPLIQTALRAVCHRDTRSARPGGNCAPGLPRTFS